jgi:DMSO reductase anchor subunit
VGLLDAIANLFAVVSVLSGAIGLYYMYKLYRIPARPFWNHWQTGSAFVGTLLSFGALLIAIVSVCILPLAEMQVLLQGLAVVMVLGLAIEGYGHIAHARDMEGASHEGAASYYHQVTEYGKSYGLRNGLLAFNLALAIVIAVMGLSGVIGYLAGLVLVISMLVMAAFGRSLFFVLVIPTTMPGAFFWKNKGFVEHARATGLADAPQHGVAYERHHAFKVDELIKTIKETSVAEMFEHIRGIFGK